MSSRTYLWASSSKCTKFESKKLELERGVSEPTVPAIARRLVLAARTHLTSFGCFCIAFLVAELLHTLLLNLLLQQRFELDAHIGFVSPSAQESF